jgi:short-subunit dehydrogenase
MPSTRSLAAITGASSGIGATFARALAARGSDLILIARRADRLQALAAELAERHGAKVEIVTADLTLDADLARVADGLRAASRLDLLVNNAGFGAGGMFAATELAGQEGMHRLHIMATLRLTHAVLPGMVARGAGAVINVSSVAAFIPSPGATGYAASKSWINTFTEGIWLELRGAGSPVQVQALCPGFTYSEFHDVAHMDRSKLAPPAWWCSAERVVAESLAGLERDRVFVIPSFRYRALVALVTRIPRPLRRALLLRVARRSGRIPASAPAA